MSSFFFFSYISQNQHSFCPFSWWINLLFFLFYYLTITWLSHDIHDRVGFFTLLLNHYFARNSRTSWNYVPTYVLPIFICIPVHVTQDEMGILYIYHIFLDMHGLNNLHILFFHFALIAPTISTLGKKSTFCTHGLLLRILNNEKKILLICHSSVDMHRLNNLDWASHTEFYWVRQTCSLPTSKY